MAVAAQHGWGNEMTSIEILLYNVFRAQGLLDAAQLAHRAALDVEVSKRNQAIYDISTRYGVKAAVERFGLSPHRIREISKAVLLIRRNK